MRVLPILLLPLLLTSCRTTTRIEQQHIVRHDTTHVQIADTLHRITRMDTIIYTEREVIHEHIITHYDPATGQPSVQETERTIRRRADSLAVHLLDSIMQAKQIQATASHHDDITETEQEETRPVSLMDRIMRKVSDLAIILIIMTLVSLAIRYYRRP